MSVVTTESAERIAVIAINRPEKRNALIQRWRTIYLRTGGDSFQAMTRVAVLTASGDQSFTIPADLDGKPPDLWRAVPRIGVGVESRLSAGWVLDAGLVLANHCDLLVAGDNATFLCPEASVGFWAGGCQRE